MLKMSSSDSNSGVAGGAQVAKGSIPSSVWKTIQQIKEITENHSEEEIYAMLKECSMDPNETTQKLIFQDTFHEVKRKRDRRKENMNNKSGELNWKAGTQGRGNKGGSGNYSSRYASHDAGGGRKSISGKVNGTSQVLEKSISPTSIPSSQAENNNTSLSIASPNEPSGVAYAPTTGAVAGKLEGQPEHLIDAKKSPKVGQVTSDMHGQQMQNLSNSTATNASFPSSGVNFSASDPVLFPSQDAQPDGMGAIRHEVGNQHAPDEHFPSNSNDSEVTSATSEVGSSNVQGKMASKSQGPGKNLPLESSQPVSTLGGCSVGRLSSNYNNRLLVIGPQKAGPVKEWKPKATSANPAQVYVTAVSSEVPTVSVEPNTEVQPVPVVLGTEEATLELQKKFEESHILEVQHVIIPNHLHVPEAEKLGFCFGSFDATYGLNTTSNSGTKNDKNPSLSETSDAIEETAKEQLPSDGSALATVDEADYPDPPPSSSSQEQENLSSKGDELSSSIVESNKSKQENVHGDHQYSIVQTSPNHSYGIMPPILGSQLGPLENSESQACDMSRLPNFVVPQPFDPTSYYPQFCRSGGDGDGRISPFHSAGVQAKYNGNVAIISPQTTQSNQEGANPLVLTTAAAASLVTQTAGLIQSSIAVPQPPLAVYRQPSGVHLTHYPPNYFPYGHYFSPFFVPPPVIHQFLSNGAFPQQPLAGGVYPPSPAAAAKYSLSQYKQGANVANSTHVGLPSNYGPYGSSTANYNPTSAATAGNPTSNEDLSASQLKESNVYDSTQQNEGSGVWITAPGRDVSSLQASSFYSLPQNHVAFTPTQPGHGTIAGIYHPVPPVTNPTLHPLLQQSQAMAGPVDMVGPTATVYQQPQYSQLNWPNNY